MQLARHTEAEHPFLSVPPKPCRPDMFSYTCMRSKIIFFKMGKISSYFSFGAFKKSLEKLTFLRLRFQPAEPGRGECAGAAGCRAPTKAALPALRALPRCYFVSSAADVDKSLGALEWFLKGFCPAGALFVSVVCLYRDACANGWR